MMNRKAARGAARGLIALSFWAFAIAALADCALEHEPEPAPEVVTSPVVEQMPADASVDAPKPSSSTDSWEPDGPFAPTGNNGPPVGGCPPRCGGGETWR
jgi:hypothetical protein